MSEIKDNKDNFENTALDTEVENLFDETDDSPEAARDAVLESMDKTKKDSEILTHQKRITEMIYSIDNLIFLKKIEDYIEIPYRLAKKEKED